MPVPSSIDDLDENPNNNSPQSSETVGPNANAYLQAAFAFIKQIHDDYVPRDGSEALTASLDAGTQKIINLLAGVAPTDAATVAQVTAVNKIGDIKAWHGAVANIATVQGPGWQLADGTNGTANLINRFILGAGPGGQAPGIAGGNFQSTLSIPNLPAHGHVVNDPTHNHGINQTPHGHGVIDNGHEHGTIVGGFLGPAAGTGLVGNGGSIGSVPTTGSSATGIGIQSQLANVANVASGTGITLQSTGSGTAFDTVPPYYTLCYIEYTG